MYALSNDKNYVKSEAEMKREANRENKQAEKVRKEDEKAREKEEKAREKERRKEEKARNMTNGNVVVITAKDTDDEEKPQSCGFLNCMCDDLFRSCRRGPKSWCLKYFWEGQTLTEGTAEAEKNYDSLPLSKRILIKYRRQIGMFAPAILVHIFWWAFMIYNNTWWFFVDKWKITVTMILGGLVAGMTTMGGGAVAYPVMTLALGVDPSVARDFALMVQGSGMSCATFSILFSGVVIDWHTILIAIPTGFVGMILGFHFVDPALLPGQKKMIFVSIWFAFGLVLLILNLFRKRRTFDTIPEFKLWKGLVLVVTGFAGGLCTSFAGGGLDICNFAVLTTLFRVSEKTATPTSVVLMATVSLIGWCWRGIMFHGIAKETWQYIACSMQIVVFMAPLGSMLGTHFHRLTLAFFVVLLNLASFTAAYCILDLTANIITISMCILVGGAGFFFVLTLIGGRLLVDYEKREHRPTVVELGDLDTGDIPVIISGTKSGGVSNTGFVPDERIEVTM